MKQVEFDIELVKKIQSGEVKGKVHIRDGREARFLGEIKNIEYPLIFAIRHKETNEEYLQTNTASGKYLTNKRESVSDIILEIEEPKQEYQFKPFDKVLVRDSDSGIWSADFFSYLRGEEFLFNHVCVGNSYTQCIPYDGNEHLLGTTDKPQNKCIHFIKND